MNEKMEKETKKTKYQLQDACNISAVRYRYVMMTNENQLTRCNT